MGRLLYVVRRESSLGLGNYRRFKLKDKDKLRVNLKHLVYYILL